MDGAQGNKSVGASYGADFDADRCQHDFTRCDHISNDPETAFRPQNVALTVAYEGTFYLGWQKTKEGASIEECLNKALHTLLQREVSVFAASRTDRGVHAEAQVVHFLLEDPIPLSKLQHILNSLLPKDIRILAVKEVSLDFHATLSARKKEYLYLVDTNSIQSPFDRFEAWHYPHELNHNAMVEASQHFIGTKDFRSFQNSGSYERSTISTLETLSITKGPVYHFTLIGKSFLYKMVRNIVGTLVYVGRGKIAPTEIEPLFTNPLRSNAGICAPAHGLRLKRVYYDFTK